MNFSIGKCRVGEGEPVFIVAEVGQAHDGSLGTAYALIDVAADSGVDAIKFQTHIAEAESTPAEPFRVKFSKQDATRYEYWKRMEFTLEQWQDLTRYARGKGLEFFSSPFSVEAVELLEKCDVPAWKVGSGETTNCVLIDRMIATGKPILVSTGMSKWDEIEVTVNKIVQAGVPVMLYQCCSKYPTIPEDVGLPLIEAMKKRFFLPVGLSDHSGSPYFSVAAAALGASSVEVHIALSEYSFGPDVPSSLYPLELKQMVEGIRLVEKSMNYRQDKNVMAKELQPMREMFGRSVVAKSDLKAGTILRAECLSVKKPSGGIPPSKMKELIGKKLVRDIAFDSMLIATDLVDE